MSKPARHPVSARLDRYADVVGRGVGRTALFLAVYGMGCVMFIVARQVTSASLRIQVPVLTLIGLLIALEFAFIWTDAFRRSLFEWMKPLGLLTPFLVTGFYIPLSLGFFSSVTVVLAGHGVLDLAIENVPSDVLSGRVTDFYGWHLLDAIPLIDAAETLRWSVPFTYESSGLGALLLTFKLTVIIPAFGVFGSYVRYRTAQHEASSYAG